VPIFGARLTIVADAEVAIVERPPQRLVLQTVLCEFQPEIGVRHGEKASQGDE
jgi:hypothetical protein